MTPSSPPQPLPRAYVFFDGQNLFHHAKREFGYAVANFCPFLLANKICQDRGWNLMHVRFYTGVPSEHQNRKLSVFWANKGKGMKRLGVAFETRTLNPKTSTVRLYDDVTIHPTEVTEYTGRLLYDDGREVPDGTTLHAHTFGEKGIDVRIAVDVIRFYAEGQYDVAVIFSQDKDLSEAVVEVKRLASVAGRTVTVASVFPSRNGSGGMPNTIRIPIDQAFYDQCLDKNTQNYFPKQ